MKDPVTVSTGITYDRDSIQKWLFSFKNSTCPVTKQVLSVKTDDIIPNHALRRLIQHWLTTHHHASHRGTERIPAPKPAVEESQIVKIIYESEKFPQALLTNLKWLRSVAVEGESSNRNCMEASGVIQFLISILRNNKDEMANEEIREEALIVLYHLNANESPIFKCIVDDEIERHELVDAFLHAMKHGRSKTRVYATMLLKSVYEITDPTRVSLKPEIFTELVRVLRDQISYQAAASALKILCKVCHSGRNRIKAIDAGTVHVTVELLLDKVSGERRVYELLLTLLDQLCGCAEGRAELLAHSAGLAVVGKKMLEVSCLASYRAVRVVEKVCRFSATARVLKEMAEVGIVEKLCLAVETAETGSSGVVKMKERAREILRLYSRDWKGSSCVPNYLLST